MRIALILFLLVAGCFPADALVAPGRALGKARTFTLRLENTIRRGIDRFRPPRARAPFSFRYLQPGRPLENPARMLEVRNLAPSLAFPINHEDGGVMGSGFVIRSASGRLYAVTSYHVAGSAGKPVGVLLLPATGGAVEFENLRVSSGGKLGVNAPDVSIIELPENAKKVAVPLEISPVAPQPGENLFMWGVPYDRADFALVKNLRVEDSYGMKTVLSPKEETGPLEGMCGAPVFGENGLVTGIYSGRGCHEGDMFAVDARKALNWLLQQYEGRVNAPYTFQFMGREALALGERENVGRIRLVRADGILLREIDFTVYRDRLDASHLEDLFPDANGGDVLEFEIIKNRDIERWEWFVVP